MTEYTPEKVAELVETANAMREQLGEDYPKTGSILDLWLRTADALTAVSAERDGLGREVESYDNILGWQGKTLTAIVNEVRGTPPPLTHYSHHNAVELVQSVVADRDRLHKAITEALAEEERCTDQRTRMWRILRAALDKERGDDE